MHVRMRVRVLTWLGVLCFWQLSAGNAAATAKFNLSYEHVANELIVTYRESASLRDRADLRAGFGAKSVTAFHSSPAELLRFAAMSAGDLEAMAAILAADPRVRSVEANTTSKVTPSW